MGELAQRVKDWQLGVGGREKGEGQGDCTTNDGVTVVKLRGVCLCSHFYRQIAGYGMSVLIIG